MKKMKRNALLLSLLLILTCVNGCTVPRTPSVNGSETISTAETTVETTTESTTSAEEKNENDNGSPGKAFPTTEATDTEIATGETTEESASRESSAGTEPLSLAASELTSFDPASVPVWDGSSPWVDINGGTPFFNLENYNGESFEYYSPLDAYGRCGTAFACVGTDIMPTEPRGEIGSVRPSGWHLVKYNGIVDGNYLYNRCHLIAFQLAGENANPENLITGTRYLNIQGMLPFENKTADYVKSGAGHVLYRVTPVFTGNNLLADGVLMEGESLEDAGASIRFCVFCYNAQPGITIDYATGDSSLQEGYTEDTTAAETTAAPAETTAPASPATTAAQSREETQSYVLNTNTMKFHRPDCRAVSRMKPENRQDYTGTRESLISQGYSPCGICHP